MNLIADCSTMHGRSARGVSDGPSDGDPGADERALREDQRDDHPGQVGIAQLVGDRAEADLGELADEEVRREDHERHQQDVPRANAAKRRQLGLRRPVAAAAPLAELLEPDLVRARQVAQVRGQRGALQIGKRTGDGVSPTGMRGPREARAPGRRARSTRPAARPRRGRARIAGPRASRRRSRRASARPSTHEHVARVEPAVRDPGRVQTSDLLPELSERAVVDVIRGRELEWVDGGCRVTITASPSAPRPTVTTSGARTPACVARSVATASCSTCSSRPTGALRGGSR